MTKKRKTVRKQRRSQRRTRQLEERVERLEKNATRRSWPWQLLKAAVTGLTLRSAVRTGKGLPELANIIKEHNSLS